MDRRLMCQVNLGDHEAFNENLDLLEPHQISQYKEAFSPYKKMGNNVYRFQDCYYNNARFVIYSELPYSSKFARCGTKVFGMAGNCKKRMLCTCCSYKAGTQAFERFKDCFHGRTCYFVTFGYSEPLPWEFRNDSAVYWKAADYALKEVLNPKQDGAIVSDEMHIRNMHPVTLNPHTHAVLSFSGFSDAFDLEQSLQDKVVEYLKMDHAEFVPRRTPNVQVTLIEDVDDYQGSIRYLFKPIDLKDQYDSATILHGTSPEFMTALNSEMKDFLKWFTVNRTMKKMVRYKGVFSSGGNFIGVSVKALKRQRRAQRQGRVIRGMPTNERFQLSSAAARAARQADSIFAPI